jgi:hypothetical protein
MQGPNLRYPDVREAAVAFLTKHHPSGSLPIPIEDIVERQMNIAVFAVPGIKLLLGVDAFITSDFKQITVDSRCFSVYPERTRFSIAHEIGHLILHKQWYEKYGPRDIDDYLRSHDLIDNQIYKFIEIQAQTFAGLILVPTELLLSELKKRFGRVPASQPPEVLAPYIQDLPELFNVSDAVILRRLEREKILQINTNRQLSNNKSRF